MLLYYGQIKCDISNISLRCTRSVGNGAELLADV